MNRMNTEIGEHNLSYLRETNKPITGKIYYQLAEGGSENIRNSKFHPAATLSATESS